MRVTCQWLSGCSCAFHETLIFIQGFLDLAHLSSLDMIPWAAGRRVHATWSQCSRAPKKTPKLRTSAPNSFIAVPVEHYQTRRLHSNASLLWQKGSLCRGTNENEKPHSRWKRGWYLPWLGEVGICCQNTKTHTRTHKHSAAVQCFSEKMQLEHTNHSQDPDCPKVESVQLFTLLWSL